jgi:hypothetical protein
MPFSYDRAWADLVAMFRGNWGILLAVAGALMFFPSFVLFTFAPLPEPAEGSGQTDVFNLMIGYYQANVVWFLLVTALTTWAQGAILLLLLDRERPTVAEAFTRAAQLFPALFLATLLTNLAIGAGVALLIVPGVYLLGRLAVVMPRIADRRLSNPITAIVDSWTLTMRRGWRIAGLVILVAVVAWITFTAMQSVLTVVGALLVPETARPLVGGFANGLSGTALNLLMMVLGAAIYLQVNGDTRGAEIAR